MKLKKLPDSKIVSILCPGEESLDNFRGPLGGQYWTMNRGIEHFSKSITHFFDLHPWKEEEKPMYLSRLKDLSCEVILHEDFPFEYILYCTGNTYFDNTLSWLLAYAYLVVEPQMIYIYGAGVHPTTDVFLQRSCIEYWIGFLTGKGIDIRIQPESIFCRTKSPYCVEAP